jgi:CheY-like chemotaxis protein
MTHTVLVVDDDPAVLDVVVDMLEELGCEVISAPSGAGQRPLRRGPARSRVHGQQWFGRRRADRRSMNVFRECVAGCAATVRLRNRDEKTRSGCCPRG